MSVNKVIILGRVGANPEVKYMPSGNAVVNLSIATNRKFKNQDTGSYDDKTEWHRVVFFNKPAETIGQYVKRIRKKFKRIDPDFSAIETRYGSGYRWNVK